MLGLHIYINNKSASTSWGMEESSHHPAPKVQLADPWTPSFGAHHALETLLVKLQISWFIIKTNRLAKANVSNMFIVARAVKRAQSSMQNCFRSITRDCSALQGQRSRPTLFCSKISAQLPSRQRSICSSLQCRKLVLDACRQSRKVCLYIAGVWMRKICSTTVSKQQSCDKFAYKQQELAVSCISNI